jgi:hypothetical protein
MLKNIDIAFGEIGRSGKLIAAVDAVLQAQLSPR